jgi:hypothetical protein
VGQPLIRDVLGSRVGLRTHDPALTGYLDRLYAEFPDAHESDHEYTIGPDADGGFTLHLDDERISEDPAAEALITPLVQHLNRTVATDCPDVLVHAGGVERDGVAVILPAYMEQGKTTLTTGLVRAGFGYLTDEAVVIRRDTRSIIPYPKPLSIDPGAWFLYPELEPQEPFTTDGYKKAQWQVPPAAIRPDALGRASQARFIVFPGYDPDVTTELIPLSRADALIELAKNTFRFDQEGRPTLEVLGAVVAECAVYRLPNRSLDEAIACISALFD